MVEEPADTVCSTRNWRTTGGGMLQDDGASANDGTSGAEGHRLTYICPKGFSGLYRLLVRRVWGEVVTGKVTVEVVTHYNTAKRRESSRKSRWTKARPS